MHSCKKRICQCRQRSLTIIEFHAAWKYGYAARRPCSSAHVCPNRLRDRDQVYKAIDEGNKRSLSSEVSDHYMEIVANIMRTDSYSPQQYCPRFAHLALAIRSLVKVIACLYKKREAYKVRLRSF